MKPTMKSVVVTIVLLTALVLQPFARPLALFAQDTPQANPQGNQSHALYLPLIATKAGAPTFEFITPAAGATVAGTAIVAIRSLDGQAITSVTFRAGNTLLATDNTPADGFRAFLDARQFPAGALTLTATARTTGGESSQNRIVTILPDPPSSGTLNNEGSGVFDSQIGSVISLRPGSAPPGTQVSVTELSQEQVTAQHQIDWEGIGVTFLGAQQIESSAPLVEPFAGVSSAGFGNRVQPGQAVVNYRLAPDADGDGISEIVVVNTASVAPGGDVVADPLTQPRLLSVNLFPTQAGVDITAATGTATISAQPGAWLTVDATGMNGAALQGNVARYRSLQDDSVQEVAASIYNDPATDDAAYTLLSIVPLLPPGLATLQIVNQSSGFATDPLTITVQALPTPTQPAQTVIDGFILQLKTDLQNFTVADSVPGAAQIRQLLQDGRTQMQQVQSQLAEAIQQIDAIASPTDKATAYQALERMAAMLHNIQVGYTASAAFSAQTAEMACNPNLKDDLARLTTLGQSLGTVARPLRVAAVIVTPFNPVAGAILGAASTTFSAASYAIKGANLLMKYGCKQPKPKCTPTQSPVGPTGMGAAPPPGGNGCGGANSGGGGVLQAASLDDSLAGRIAVRVYINGQATPFTGVTDAGGYFFVPFIPEDEPFTAIAYDQVSGQRRNFNGVGPKTGESLYLIFDFSTGEDTTNVTWDGEGDGKSWGDPKNWSGDSLPVDTSHVTIADAPGRTVLITNTVKIASLRTDAAVTIDTKSYLDLLGPSAFSKGVTLRPNAWVTAYGDDTVVTIGGDQLTVANGATLFAYGNRAGFRLTAAGTTLAPGGVLAALGVNATITASSAISLTGGGLYAAGGAQIRLPQATTYMGDIRALDYTSMNVPYDIQDGCSSSISGMSAICALGANSYIDLSGLTTFVGETWTGFFGSVGYTGIRANEGGQIDLSNLTAVSQGRMAALARGVGSKLDLSKLQSAGDRSYFLSIDQGGLDIRSLSDLHTATLDIGNSTAIQTSQITNLTNAILYVDQSAPDFSNVTNINGSSFYATGGGQIVFPQISAYASDGRGFFTTIEATGAGSQIAFPNVTTVIGNEFVNDTLVMTAKEGGQIKFPKLTTITGGKVQMNAEQSNSLIDLPLLTTFLRGGRGESWLKATGGGRIATPQLTTLNGVSLYFAPNGTLDSVQISSFTNGWVDATGVTPNLGGMTDVTGSSFIAHSGGKISLPQVTSYSATSDEFFPTLRAEGAGSLVDFSTVTAFTGQTNGGDAQIEAQNGGVVRLNQVAAISDGRVRILAEGANARVELKTLTQLTSGPSGGRSGLTIRNGGVIDHNNNTLTTERSDVTLGKPGNLLVGPLQLNDDGWLLGTGGLPNAVGLNNSTLSPGDNAAGKVEIGATLTLADASKYVAEIGGNQAGVTFDQVTVAGNAVLTGTLEISLINGYTPPLNSSFAILTAGAVSGSFTTVTGAEIGNGRKFNVVYSGTGVTLQVVAAP